MTPRKLPGCFIGLLALWLFSVQQAPAEFTDADAVQELVDRAIELNLNAPVSETRAWLESIADRLESGTDTQRHQVGLISARLHALAGDHPRALDELANLLDKPLIPTQRLRALELAANIGMTNTSYDLAFRYLNEALEFQRQVDDAQLRSRIFGLASYWHAQLGDRSKGLAYAQTAMQLAERTGDARTICIALEKLAQAEEMAGLHDEALDSYRAGINACEQANDPVFIGVMKVLTGRLLHRMGQSEEAESWLREGLADTEHAGFEDGVLDGKLNYAELLYDQGRFDEARALLEPIIDTLRRHDRLAKLSDAYALMAGLKTQAGEHARAYNYLRDHLSLREQVLDSERTRLIAFYEVEFDAISREQELALLREQARVARLQEATHLQQRRLRQLGLVIAALVIFGLSLLLLNALRERRHYRQLSESDPLTGLNNHTRFFEQLEALLAEHGDARPFTLVLADVDHFKQVNDRHGHLVGDRVLRAAASVFRQALAENGLLGRIGGEEFAAALPGQGIGQARRSLETLRELLHARLGHRLDRPVTMSFGLAERVPGESIDQWRERADQALYRAKHAGRDRIEVARSSGPQAIAANP